MFSHALGIHKYVDVYQYEIVKALLKHLMHEFLEHGGVIRHDAVLCRCSTHPPQVSRWGCRHLRVPIWSRWMHHKVILVLLGHEKWIVDSELFKCLLVYGRPKKHNVFWSVLPSRGSNVNKVKCKYLSKTFCSGTESGYILPQGTGSPGINSMLQSHGLWDGYC